MKKVSTLKIKFHFYSKIYNLAEGICSFKQLI